MYIYIINNIIIIVTINNCNYKIKINILILNIVINNIINNYNYNIIIINR